MMNEPCFFSKSDLQVQDVISLADVYLSEWKHRDEWFWRQTFRYFYAILIVLFLPNLTEKYSIDIIGIPATVFYHMAFFMSLFFWYLAIGYSKRLEAVSKVYITLLETMPEDYCRINLSDETKIKGGKWFNVRLAYIMCAIMFGAPLIISLLRLFHIL